MLIRDPDGLVVFSADEMAHYGGRFCNYWGSYWTCQKCQVSWGSHVVRCARCLADKTEDVAQSPVGADGWLGQQERTKLRKRLRKLDRLIAMVDRLLKLPIWLPDGINRDKAMGRRNRWDETRRQTRLRLKGYGV